MRRITAVVAIPLAIAVTIVASQLLSADRLPDTLATHWGLSGAPDGRMPALVSLALMAGIWVAIWAALVMAGRKGGPSSATTAVSYFIGGILAAVQVSIVAANLDAPSWEAADRLDPWWIALVLGAGVLLGALGWALGSGATGVGSHREIGESPITEVGPTERGAWFGGTSARWPLWFVVLMAALTPVFPGGFRLIPLSVMVVVLAFASVDVLVDESGLSVGFGWWGWPRRRVPLEGIESAEVIHVRPLEWGGWGYRVLPKASAVVVRGGEGIRVVRPDKRDFVVTVDDAAAGAGLLNGLVAARRS